MGGLDRSPDGDAAGKIQIIGQVLRAMDIMEVYYIESLP